MQSILTTNVLNSAFLHYLMVKEILITNVLIQLEFCERCKSLMNITPDGYVCPKCGYKVEFNLNIINIHRSKEKEPDPVYSAEGKEDSLIVLRSCPVCGNPEAYQTITTTIGEHSGVSSDRSILRYKCTKCFHVWIETQE